METVISTLADVARWALPIAGTLALTAIVGYLMSTKLWKPVWRSLRKPPPVFINIETDARKMFANQTYDWISFGQFVPLPIERMPAPPDGSATNMGAWARKLDGYPAWHCNYNLTITARSEMTVVVSGLRIEAKPRPLPEGCTLIKGVGGASMEFKRIQVELISGLCKAEFVAMGGAPSEPFAFELRDNGSAQFNLMVDAASDEDVDMYVWWGCLDLLLNGKSLSIRVGPTKRDIKKDHARDFHLVIAGDARSTWASQTRTQLGPSCEALTMPKPRSLDEPARSEGCYQGFQDDHEQQFGAHFWTTSHRRTCCPVPAPE